VVDLNNKSIEKNLLEQRNASLANNENFLLNMKSELDSEEQLSVVEERQEDSMHNLSYEGVTDEIKANRPIGAPAPEETKKLELKPLHANPRYEFLDQEEIIPIIVNAHLDGEQAAK
jgi:hypothetical protein